MAVTASLAHHAVTRAGEHRKLILHVTAGRWHIREPHLVPIPSGLSNTTSTLEAIPIQQLQSNMLSSIQAIFFGILAITVAALPTLERADVGIYERQVINDTVGVCTL